MHRLIADVEGKKQQPTRPQNSFHLSQGNGDLWSGNMNDRIEGGDSAQRPVLDVQREHVALPKFNARIQPPSLIHHFGRQVEPNDLHATIVEIKGNVPWSTPQDADGSKSLNFHSESEKELPVKRLMFQFPKEASGVFRSHSIVADLNVVELLVHDRRNAL